MAISAEKSITRKCIRGGHIDSSFSERFKMANLKVVLILGLICLPTIQPYFARYMLQNMEPWNGSLFYRVGELGGRRAAQEAYWDILPISQSKHSTNNFSLFGVICLALVRGLKISILVLSTFIFQRISKLLSTKRMPRASLSIPLNTTGVDMSRRVSELSVLS